jgi:propanediol dehydratase small subunit
MEMLKDDSKDQISLFELPAVQNQKDRPSATARKLTTTAINKKAPVKKKVVKGDGISASPTGRSGGKRKTGRGMEKVVLKSPLSGQVPEGDVRLTANIREDLHLKLKIAAARRRTTIGELLEEMVEKYL